MMRPVEIIGGGLAGLGLGVGLRRAGVPVMVREAGAYPRHRTCGEFINGLHPATAARLGLTDLLRQAPRRDRVTWHQRGAPPGHWCLPRPALVISRHALDARLADEFVALGGTLEVGKPAALRIESPGRVLAIGRRPDARSPWLGLKTHVTRLPLDGDLEFHIGSRGYVGLCALPDGCVNVCGLFRQNAAVRSRPVSGIGAHVRAAGLERLADRLEAADTRPDSFCAVAGLRFGRQPLPPWLPALGDAYVVLPPYTGQGMALALASAAAALTPLVTWSRGGLQWPAAVAEIQRRHTRLFAPRLRRALGLHPFLLAPAGSALAALLHRCGLVPLRRLSSLLH